LVPKLCLGTPAAKLGFAAFFLCLRPPPPAKRSFAAHVPKQSLGTRSRVGGLPVAAEEDVAALVGRHRPPTFSRSSAGRTTPCSVTKAVTSRAGVTSKAGLPAGLPSGTTSTRP